MTLERHSRASGPTSISELRQAAVVVAALTCAALLAFTGCARGTGRALASPPPLVTGAYPQYGHAADFSWVAGRFAPRPDGCIYLEFDQHRGEPWDGRIVLNAPPEMFSTFSGGDMLVAFGRLSKAPRGECGAASLDVSQIGEH
ncbi:MAG TPA: hypothetical protein VFF60_02725 [Candidatus Binatus sp.]|nr:hypothetical protein [Candidatus Binatus sp.]